jgi:hypothetical protein
MVRVMPVVHTSSSEIQAWVHGEQIGAWEVATRGGECGGVVRRWRRETNEDKSSLRKPRSSLQMDDQAMDDNCWTARRLVV